MDSIHIEVGLKHGDDSEAHEHKRREIGDVVVVDEGDRQNKDAEERIIESQFGWDNVRSLTAKPTIEGLPQI